MLFVTPDSLTHILAGSSPRPAISRAMALKYWARSIWLICGHGPASKAVLAAATARFTSASFASATLKYKSSVAQLITSILDALEGVAHSPLMKKQSGRLTGELDICVFIVQPIL